MDQILAITIAAIVSAVVGGFVGSLITIARFGSKIEAQGFALQQFVTQRGEDRANELRENERLRAEFRDFCTTQNNQRERELEFIRREFRDFRDVADRRQRYIMEVVTAIARKSGIGNRLTDGLERDGDIEHD